MLILLVGAWTLGCSAPALRSQSPETAEEVDNPVRLVGDVAVPYGLHPVKTEGIGLVVGLPGTGSDPPPTPQRAALIDEMKRRGVRNPNQVLASPTTALVVVRGYLRAGIEKGDRLDVEVRIPSQSETTSLRGGRLMPTPLKEMAVVGRQVFDGHTLAIAEGPILVDPSADALDDRTLTGRGRILGGGIARKSRPLGLVLKPERRSIAYSQRIGDALNRRFHTFSHGIKRGVATPKTDEFVELAVHPRYKDNIQRYMQVVRSVPLRESAAEKIARLKELEQQLLDPITASLAALRLEALGSHAADVLAAGVDVPDSEVRFYAAESLAYLDDPRASDTLVEAAREQPAFRVFALTALSAMDEFSAYEALLELLSVPSAETRYGAFRALWAMNERDPLVRGETLGKSGQQFYYHVLDVDGPEIVHVTRSHRPELVLFGAGQRLETPLSLEAGSQILVTSHQEGQVTVSRFDVNQPDQKRQVSNSLDEVIRAIVELDGTFPDVVQALQQARQSGALVARLEVDALPQAGRTYVRGRDLEVDDVSDSEPAFEARPAGPMPELFAERSSPKEPQAKESPELAKTGDDSPAAGRTNPVRGFFARMVGGAGL